MVYELTDFAYPWLYPALAAVGICCQLASCAIKSKKLLLAGFALTLAGAIGDRDLALAVGDALVTAALWFL